MDIERIIHLISIVVMVWLITYLRDSKKREERRYKLNKLKIEEEKEVERKRLEAETKKKIGNLEELIVSMGIKDFDRLFNEQPKYIQKEFIEKTGYNIKDIKIKSEINYLIEIMASIEPKEFDRVFNEKPKEIQDAFKKVTNYNTSDEYIEYMKENSVEVQKEWAQKTWTEQKEKLVEMKQIKWEKDKERNKKYEDLKLNKRIGYIYMLQNEAFPDFKKIGHTLRTSKERAKELSVGTGIPKEFKVIYEVETLDPKDKEAIIHKQLSKYRTSKSGNKTEFFEVSFEFAKSIIDSVVVKPQNL